MQQNNHLSNIFAEVINIKTLFTSATLSAIAEVNSEGCLRKTIAHRSQIETKYLKTKTQTDLKLYKKHKNFCSKLYKKERRKYYETLDMKNILDSKKFWKTIEPFLSDKNSFLTNWHRKK